jgi:hypothetical protein
MFQVGLISVAVAVAIAGVSSSVVVSDTKGSAVVVTVFAANVSANGSVWVPRWVDPMDAVVLLSISLLILLLLDSSSEDERGQSHQNQKGLRNNVKYD